MHLYEIDRAAVSGTGPLHRLPAGVKLLLLAVLIALLLSVRSLPLHAGVLLGLLLLALLARVPLVLMLELTAYPLIFLAIIFFSIDGLTLPAALGLAARVLAITAAVILLLLTTSFPALFAALGRVLPGALVAALFFTYRALFILAVSLANIRTALRLRGGLDWRHPLRSLTNLGKALGHLLVDVVEMSQRMADGLTLRGFQHRIYSSGSTHVRHHH